MTSNRHPDIHPVIRKLESIFSLNDAEREAILRLPIQVARLSADQDIVREGDRPSRSCAVLEGFTCSYQTTEAGGRQIVSFAVPGDIPDLQSLHLKTMDCSLGTLTPCKLAFIQHEHLRYLCESYPRIAAALWRETLIEAAIYRSWMTSMGRLDATAQIAHLFCEMVVRLRAVGLADDKGCDLPLTQQEIADALGMTDVHVNRTVRHLREAGLVTFKGGVLSVPDLDSLAKVGEFEPAYLHLRAASHDLRPAALAGAQAG